MNIKFNLLMKESSIAVILAEQVQCISLLMLSGKLPRDESETIESILQEKLSALVDASSNIQSSIAFDFALKDEIKAEKQATSTQNSFSARLRLAIAHSGMIQSALAWGVGVSQSTISALVTGKSKEAGIVRARAIAETLEINAKWLLYGEGEMLPAKFLTHSNKV